ncbi:MAG: 3-hydroxybutyrate dehydrogenase [Gammaproteobacteria bacterium]|nr:3-hydroxybutyrate dehydrogenase [Gammaproteobacteria bacterium]MBU2056118.1 3-hydroxybutyrate dehydrogenase [Gammaproteobacteria bacterium]MBU2175696.1 3-hydroxybutyrate dehydrogenase [Gammaproteobacteria bacterium]MBU2245403.1 3-hydroxybutyrate dehydrogenase [Gammaproteobacteria bacterium]MBU2344688.1 3-hydroxybutyrate dehydrogenase [Gammaproteobacteria bacterium]
MNVLITGGTGGIGFAVAEHFGALGHHVILADINAAQLEIRQHQLTAAGYKASSILLNLTEQASIEACAHAYQIDILINNAGVQHVARLEDFPEEKWQQLLQVMLTGPAMLTKAVLPRMQQQGFGRVINIGSIHALVASPFKSAYVAAKHGLLGFSKVVALENAHFDFTINTICPAYVRTPLVDQQIAAQSKEHNLTEQQVIDQIMLAPMPQKAFIGVDEIASTAAFLCEPAARHMTAQTLVLDGGWTAR